VDDGHKNSSFSVFNLMFRRFSSVYGLTRGFGFPGRCGYRFVSNGEKNVNGGGIGNGNEQGYWLIEMQSNVMGIMKAKEELYERMLGLTKEKEAVNDRLTKEKEAVNDRLTKEKEELNDRLTKEKEEATNRLTKEKEEVTKDFFEQREKVIRVEHKHQRVVNELLATQGKLNLRGALEYVRFKQVPHASYKTPWSEVVTCLKRDKNFVARLNDCAKSGAVQPKDVDASLPGLYSHASGQLHGIDGKIAIAKGYWNPGQRIALSAILRHHDMEFIVLNEDGSEEAPVC